jgi:hypothetical protein
MQAWTRMCLYNREYGSECELVPCEVDGLVRGEKRNVSGDDSPAI